MIDRNAQRQIKALDHVMLAYRLASEHRLHGPVPRIWTELLQRIDERVGEEIDLGALLAFAGPPRRPNGI